jgi:hypothetical protein
LSLQTNGDDDATTETAAETAADGAAAGGGGDPPMTEAADGAGGADRQAQLKELEAELKGAIATQDGLPEGSKHFVQSHIDGLKNRIEALKTAGSTSTALVVTPRALTIADGAGAGGGNGGGRRGKYNVDWMKFPPGDALDEPVLVLDLLGDYTSMVDKPLTNWVSTRAGNSNAASLTTNGVGLGDHTMHRIDGQGRSQYITHEGGLRWFFTVIKRQGVSGKAKKNYCG